MPAVPAAGSPPEPSIVSWPETVTATPPALPEANVLAAIAALLRMVKVPALTTTLPAEPLLPRTACEKIPPEPSIVSWPETETERLPALPEANVLPETSPPLAMLNDLAVTTADPGW